jgi:hypothetical protein
MDVNPSTSSGQASTLRGAVPSRLVRFCEASFRIADFVGVAKTFISSPNGDVGAGVMGDDEILGRVPKCSEW